MDFPRLLIGIGLLLLVVGLAWPLLGKLGLGHLPGDIVIERGNSRFYFPLMTCILLSILASAVIWLLNR
jgi:hypothetical protein